MNVLLKYRALRNLLISFIVFLGAVLLIMAGSTCWIKVNQIDIQANQLPAQYNGLRIVHMSDTHSVNIGSFQDNIISAVKQEKPDFIVFTGDILDGSHKPEFEKEQALELIQGLISIAPVYFVTGNHDYCIDNVEKFFQELKKLDIILLDNESVCLSRGDSTLYIAGVSDPFTGRDNLSKALQGINKEDYCILLSHTPELFNESLEKGVDLICAGHYHGGQIRMPFMRAIYAPGGGFFPEYDSGLYSKENSYMYLSRGLGYTGIFPFRFWNRPEIAVINLNTR